MPTYEYACKNCGHRFEAWQKITDEPLTECPECHCEIHRVLFPAGVVFKGSGFYSTDHRGHKSGGESRESSHESSGEAAAKSGTATEAKSGTATETKAASTGDSKSDSKGETKPAATAASETAKAS